MPKSPPKNPDADQEVVDLASLIAHQYPFLDFEPWEKQVEASGIDKSVKLLAWANRCGKTTWGAYECVMAAMGTHPSGFYPDPPFTIWACSVDYKQMRDSIIPAFEGDSTHPRQLPEGVTLNQHTMSYPLPNGSIIRLKSADSGRASFQGAALPLIWLDEELPEAILKELFVRIGPGYKRRIVWTMTAISGHSFPYFQFYLPWKEAQDAGREHPDYWYSVAGMQDAVDAGILDQEEVDKVIRLFPPESKELKVRTQGGFVDMVGESLFSDDCIAHHKKSCRKPKWRVVLSNANRKTRKTMKVVNAPKWPQWQVDVWHKPRKGDQYVIGADVAEGKLADPGNIDSSRDWSVAAVFNRTRRRFDAFIRCRLDPITYGKKLWLLGMWYNHAWQVPEINFNGAAVLGVLVGKVDTWPLYNRIYQRRKDIDEWAEDIVADDLGYRTTTANRGFLYSNLREALEIIELQSPPKLYYDVCVEEMCVFQRDKKGKIQAAIGHHDDTITAMALAIEGDSHCPVFSSPDEGPDLTTPDGTDAQEYQDHILGNAQMPDHCLDVLNSTEEDY